MIIATVTSSHRSIMMIIAIFSNNYDNGDNWNDDDGKMVIPEKNNEYKND